MDSLNIILVGDSGVGKTALINRLKHVDEFIKEHVPTTDVNITTFDIVANPIGKVTLNIWEIPGCFDLEEGQVDYTKYYYQRADVAIVMFSSLDCQIQKWVDSIREIKQTIPIILCATKCENITDDQYAKMVSLFANFYKISVKSNFQCKELITEILQIKEYGDRIIECQSCGCIDNVTIHTFDWIRWTKKKDGKNSKTKLDVYLCHYCWQEARSIKKLYGYDEKEAYQYFDNISLNHRYLPITKNKVYIFDAKMIENYTKCTYQCAKHLTCQAFHASKCTDHQDTTLQTLDQFFEDFNFLPLSFCEFSERLRYLEPQYLLHFDAPKMFRWAIQQFSV